MVDKLTQPIFLLLESVSGVLFQKFVDLDLGYVLIWSDDWMNLWKAVDWGEIWKMVEVTVYFYYYWVGKIV